MAGRVEGKVALITGAARGMGRAHAVRLAAEGADVVLVDVCAPLPGVAYESATPADLEETVALVEKAGRRAVAAQLDVRDLDALRAAVDGAVAGLGRLDVVVANAGICVPRAWDQVTPQIFEDTMSTNVTGVWNTVMAGAPHLVAAGGGSIVLVSSAAGIKVQPFMVPYTASKFAVRGMAKAFAAELAKHHIRVNSLHPTGVATPMGSGDMQAVLGAAMAGDQRLGMMFANMLPVETTQPEDVADSVLFLASDESRYVTAHELAPDAGVTEF
ncbi:mycofactocin-coupled SDR family oxidoreductase [Pseudonocardia sp. KRD-184]|uniref:Mycofactocin-coupled SDR family oxidoreductase n=1 Tax=Pseudonocardia oceani TaxID=2792013 RepID=A0ABS6U9T4_9PSEU|nr:mycofactocin-coupled SDR family oxidoreductase [Pseudonocardia oceani]MBW0089654.1 mycofactocin-coupled SDR family oxidoreductase [Pseudonocardia oceani]MBW0094784.1 mycofactocin-coupled SDR family oxidoreductase [Pseudonocardia oceani]MBW0110765.1 mycofactocin-coupled SDR family oxidoreductase [Pseudonocardia oceani]MBW0123545.1 mycofactocin-coupled SDR family oxidoreductase [Pseudonocardia oceani]MBW0129016.1 mycofactocin-coupled SDR family oxidoreductase [Pseudonocardia oceani]